MNDAPTEKRPRIEPVEREAWSEELASLLAPVTRKSGDAFNIFKTFAHHPPALKAFLGWGTYVLNESTLPARERELVILRVAHLVKSDYEWIQHVRIARHVGVSDDEIARVKEGADAAGWSAADAALLRAADELHASQEVSDETWADLCLHLSRQQCMDLVFTVGQYTLVAMALKSFRVSVDDGL